MDTRKKWQTHSPNQTIERGRLIARTLHPGTMIALVGELGSGKTTFVKGLALGLGVKDSREVKSPTFVILHMYNGRVPLYHFDLYRIDSSSDLDQMGIEEFLSDPNVVSVVEWADRIPSILSEADLKVEFSRSGETDRVIQVKARGR